MFRNVLNFAFKGNVIDYNYIIILLYYTIIITLYYLHCKQMNVIGDIIWVMIMVLDIHPRMIPQLLL